MRGIGTGLWSKEVSCIFVRTLVPTDHRSPAASRSTQPTSSDIAARIRRWSILLSAYEYTITFRKTQAHGNADALSWLPLPVVPVESELPPELVLLMEHLEESPVTAQHIKTWTRRDPILSTVLQHVTEGWPDQDDPELTAYAQKKQELSVHSMGIKGDCSTPRKESSSSGVT